MAYGNVCAKYGLEHQRSKWETPPRVVKNDHAKIPWDFQIQTDKLVMTNHLDIVFAPPGRRPRTHSKRLYLSAAPGTPDKLEEVAREREAWASLLRKLPLKPGPG